MMPRASGQAGDLQYLTQAAIAGKIDDATYVDELKRRGIVSDTADTETILARIGNAAPALGGSMNLDHAH